jgi:enoyl-CoA hydratase/carnithine racemase
MPLTVPLRTDFATIKVDLSADRVCLVTLNRPEVRNAMNSQMMTDLRDCFQQFYVQENAAACIVITGVGDQAFCSGGDLKERRGMTDETWRRQHAIIEQMVRAIMDCPVPIIAAVNGAAYAGGMEIALACDFVYAADHARFALTEVTLGIMPGAAGTQNLPRAEIILTGTPFTAADGYEWGMINKVVPGPELMAATLETARKIASNAPVSIRQAKKSMDKSTDLDRAAGYAFEIESYNRTVGTEDRHEGINAFNEKRKPAYKGR